MSVRVSMSKPNANKPEPIHEAVPVVEAFFQSHDAHHFVENGEWVDTAQSITARGRAQIADVIRRWYVEDFCEAHDEPLNLIVTDDTVVAEWIFHGKPRQQATGDAAEISVSIVAVFEVYEHMIQRVRLYYDLAKRLTHV
jgi:predicted GNAT superfamily acetyltransferase